MDGFALESSRGVDPFSRQAAAAKVLNEVRAWFESYAATR
jgi:hypothetical protein